MSVHPVLEEWLNTALGGTEPVAFTRRDARFPPVPAKANAVIGMRRAGKTTFLRQLIAERRSVLRPRGHCT
jgi:predicted AAA+ superfamily ATPase